MEQEIKRRRIDEDGEWEYECSHCNNWLPKKKYRGCKHYVDAWGNCRVCSSCRMALGHLNRIQNEREIVDEILEGIGFTKYKDSSEWLEAMKLKYGK